MPLKCFSKAGGRLQDYQHNTQWWQFLLVGDGLGCLFSSQQNCTCRCRRGSATREGEATHHQKQEPRPDHYGGTARVTGRVSSP